jgi:hypothetical protein
MVAPMTPQANRLLSYLNEQHKDTFFENLIPLLEEFAISITGSRLPLRF